MHTVIIILHVICTLFLILVILLQTGKGAAMGSGLGGGSSQTMFGSSGAGNFLTKSTAAIAALFIKVHFSRHRGDTLIFSKDFNCHSLILI